jgi:hypothetical protein
VARAAAAAAAVRDVDSVPMESVMNQRVPQKIHVVQIVEIPARSLSNIVARSATLPIAVDCIVRLKRKMIQR